MAAASPATDAQFLEMSAVREYVERGGSRSSKMKAIDDWLPVTASRNAKWWYSAFHNVTAVVGVGVLGFPAAMAYLTWGPGIVVLFLSWVITLYTFWQLVEMHEMVPGRRFDRYHELGQEAFGERLGLWIIVPMQLIVQVSTDIVYMVSGGHSMLNVYRLIRNETPGLRKSSGDKEGHKEGPMGIVHFVLVFASAQFVLAQIPNFNAISGVSLAAAVMSLSYTTIAWTDSVARGRICEVNYDLPRETNHVFGVMSALGTVAFAYAGHSVALEIQASIPSTDARPSKKAMWKGVCLAYAVVAFCYLSVAIAGYWAWGREAAREDNILALLEHPKGLMIVANMMVAVHVLGSYQVYAMPVYDMLEIVLVKYFRLTPRFSLRLVARSAYVGFTTFVACLLPFFSALVAFFGGFALAPTTYFMPCVMWLILKKPKRFSLSWIINWLFIVLGVLLMVVASIGGMWSLIKDAETYHVFHLQKGLKDNRTKCEKNSA